MKIKFSGDIERGRKPNQSRLFVCRSSKSCTSNILETIYCVRLKLPGLLVEVVELTKTLYFHPNAAASTAAKAMGIKVKKNLGNI